MGKGYGPNAKAGKVDLENGYKLSIVSNKYSYGGEKGLFEIGVYYKDHDGMVIPEGWSDSVKGFLNPDGVEREIQKLSSAEANFERVSG